ncbi:MAG: hypothetical protein M1833_002992 [Piccolia ochrophora]|nr:MAG: hypothetical protein M1833_002992 [Piccolia ochrophora]
MDNQRTTAALLDRTNNNVVQLLKRFENIVALAPVNPVPSQSLGNRIVRATTDRAPSPCPKLGHDTRVAPRHGRRGISDGGRDGCFGGFDRWRLVCAGVAGEAGLVVVLMGSGVGSRRGGFAVDDQVDEGGVGVWEVVDG